MQPTALIGAVLIFRAGLEGSGNRAVLRSPVRRLTPALGGAGARKLAAATVQYEMRYNPGDLDSFASCEVNAMTTVTIREQLYKQIDDLPDDVVEQIADFTLFVMARRQIAPSHVGWSSNQWQDFALGQLFREDDEVEYSLEDAQEIYNP